MDREFVTENLECPNGHGIRLEVLSGTTHMMREIKCPSCEIEMTVFAGDIRGVSPLE